MKLTAVFPAGHYYIGDPCHLKSMTEPDSRWLRFVDWCYELDKNHSARIGKWGRPGRHIAVANTAYGDGTYLDNLGAKYKVDAGIIACLESLDEPEANHCFTEPFEVDLETPSLFIFGDVTIDTRDSEPDEDDTEEDEEEES